jgi:hypothetical protein
MPTFALNDLNFWLQFLRYIVCVFIGYFIPGDLVLSRTSFPKMFRIPLAIVIGMVLLAVQGYIVGYLNIRYMSWIYIFFCSAVWIFVRKKIYNKIISYKIDKIALFLVIIGAIGQLSTIWFTGYIANGTATYCCGDSNDNLFYGTISRQLVHALPPEQPGMVGLEFKNYHYWSNIVVAETARIFNLPVFQLQYQYSTIVLSIIIGLLLLALCNEIRATKLFSRWLLFFFYFGSDAIYWFVALNRSVPMFSMSSLEDGIGLFANYPRAMAVIVSLAAITLLFSLKRKFSITLLIITSLLFASVGGMKIYVGLFCYVGLLILSLYEVLKERRSTTLLVGILTVVFLLPIYFSANVNAGGLYYTGFWRAQNFVVQPSLNLIRYEMARLIYEADHKWPQVLVFNLGFTIFYFALIFGTKMIALLNNKTSLRKLPIEFHLFFIPPIIISALVGFFFNQDVGESNTFNFIVSSFIYLSFYAALFCSYIMETKNRWIGIIFAMCIILLTIPRAGYKIYNNINMIRYSKGFVIPPTILDAAKAIRQKTEENDVVLVDVRAFYFDKYSPVFSMLVDRPMYFSSEDFLHWFKAPVDEISKRKLIRDTIFTDSSILKVASMLKTNTIDYLITDLNQQFGSTSSASFFEHWYQNPEILVIKVHKELIPTSIFEEVAEATTASVYRYRELAAPYLRDYTGE